MLYRGLIKDDEAKINEQYVKVFRRKLSKQTLRKYFEGVRSSNHGPRGHDRDDYDRYLSYGRRGNSETMIEDMEVVVMTEEAKDHSIIKKDQRFLLKSWKLTA